MPESKRFTTQANYYQHFDTNPAMTPAAGGMGGWHRAPVALAPDHTALVVMHAWQFDHPARYPGLLRCVEYLPRADAITQQVFPRLLAAVRNSPLRVYHVTATGVPSAQQCPGFAHAKRLRNELLGAPRAASAPRPVVDPCLTELRAFRRQHGYPGRHNDADCAMAMADVRIASQAMPVGDEPVCEHADELLACCLADGVNHVIYVGFALNWCLLMSAGGMLEMSERGLMCSTIRQAVTAVENRESADGELHKEEALWRVSLRFGLVFELDSFLAGLPTREGAPVDGQPVETGARIE